MGHLATLLYASALAGCSLIYNPSNLPESTVDAQLDAPIADANPALLELQAMAESAPLLEGAGQDGAAPQILVVYGHHITKQATLEVAPKPANANVMLSVTGMSIADDGNSIAALVSAKYMDTVPESAGVIPLEIKVTQPGAPEPKTSAWSLQPLDEFVAGGNASPPAEGKRFSHATFTGNVVFATERPKAIVRVVGGIAIDGAVRADGDDASQKPGAGGCAGGKASGAGTCFGGGAAAGGGGGFFMSGNDGDSGTAGMQSGEPQVYAYDGTGASTNRGAGGGGCLLGDGGGGGGTIELTAGGNVSVKTISAKGAAGASSTMRGCGGGAGGLVVMRSGATLAMPTTLDITGGAGGPGGAGLLAGGAGSQGRFRFDANMTTGTPPANAHRGPMITRPASLISETPTLVLTVTGSQGDKLTIITVHADDSSSPSVDQDMALATVTLEAKGLHIGLNTVCVFYRDSSFATDEAKNCIEMAYIP